MEYKVAFILIMTVLLGSFLFCVYMIFRNEWVARIRADIIRDPDITAREFDAMPTYHEMLNRWWYWDVERLKNG